MAFYILLSHTLRERERSLKKKKSLCIKHCGAHFYVVSVSLKKIQNKSYLVISQDGFRDDSERIMKDIQRSSGHCQVCLLFINATFFLKF